MPVEYQTLGELREALKDMPDDTPLHNATIVMGGFYKEGVQVNAARLIKRRGTVIRCKCGGKHPDCESYSGIVFY